jgi:hypothetical protein
MVAFIGLPLASQAAPRHEGQLWLAQATGDLRDESRASLGYGLSFGRLFHGAGWTARAELGYTGFSKSRTGRPVTLRTPQGEVHTQEAVEVTRNTVSLAFQGLWRPGGGRAGPHLGLGAGMAHWYEIEHLSVAQYREIQRRTTHLLVTAHLGFDAPSGGRTGTRWVVELRGARGAQFDGRTASWVALGAGLRF